MKTKPTYSLNSKFRPTLEKGRRYNLWTGGRGAAKTFTAYAFAAMRTFEQDHNVLFSRYTMESITTSVIPEVEKAFKIMGYDEVFYKNGTKLVNSMTGNYIQFRGLKGASLSQKAREKGLEFFNTVFIDEAEEYTDEESFDKLDASIRKQGINQIILLLNPALRAHWIYQRWFKDTHKIDYINGFAIELSTHPNLLHTHTTYLDAPAEALNPSWREATEQMRINDPAKYGITRIGQWREIEAGAIFDDWSTYRTEPDGGAVAFGLDLASEQGITALVSARIIGSEVYLREHYYGVKKSRTSRLNSIKAACNTRGWHRYKIAADHNDPDFAADLRKNPQGLGARVVRAEKKNKEANIDKTKNLSIFIHHQSQNLLRQFAKFRRDERGKIVKEDDHGVDAALYAVAQAWKGDGDVNFYAAPVAGDRF